MKRIYEKVIQDHLHRYRQMIFLAGPRQVGKTTLSKSILDTQPSSLYRNYDHPIDQQAFTPDYQKLLSGLNLNQIHQHKPLLILDEIHKLKKWKDYLKGLFDTYESQLAIIVTGSSRLDLLTGCGDSLMGRYFLYRIHPLSVAELLHDQPYPGIRPPKALGEEWDQLLKFGGFPEPFFQQREDFSHRWQQRKMQQLIYEDMQSLTQVRELQQLNRLASILLAHSGQIMNISQLSKLIQAHQQSLSHWIDALELLGFGFRVKPWSNNVSRALIKQPKWYATDWSMVVDPGQRFETLVACHLQKAVHFWQDIGLGEYDLHFIRDKQKNEVNFLVTHNQVPWMLIEAKCSDNNHLSPALHHFRAQLNTPHNFQVVQNLPYVDQDPFEATQPVIVPARTLLSQWV